MLPRAGPLVVPDAVPEYTGCRDDYKKCRSEWVRGIKLRWFDDFAKGALGERRYAVSHSEEGAE